jgi:hypothetical protein
MCDVEPENGNCPEIIHVVSYSEAVQLAEPAVINESARITRAAIQHYPEYRKSSGLMDLVKSPDIDEEVEQMKQEVRSIIAAMERSVPKLYSPEGFYLVFKMGFLPVPFLWGQREEFPRASNWRVRFIKGGFAVVNAQQRPMRIEDRLALAMR